MATNTDAKYHYSIASALQSVCQSHCQRESEYKYSCQENIMLLKNVVLMSAMMSRISIHIHYVVLVERKPVFLMIKKLSVLYKVISGQNTHMQSGCDVYTTCSES